MDTFYDVVDKVTNLIVNQGYAPQLTNEYFLTGYEIYKYFFEQSKKYKLGLLPGAIPKMSYIIRRIVYDGMAYQKFMMVRPHSNYYYFRHDYGEVLDTAFMFADFDAKNNSTLIDIDIIIVSSLFRKIKEITDKIVDNDDYTIYDDEYYIPNERSFHYMLERLHLLGRSIYSCWKSGNSPRFRFIKNDLIDSYYSPSSIGW